MALDINITGNGTTLYLVNSGGAATPGGAATGISTTPWMIYNDDWTVQAAAASAIWSGGPSLRNGSSLVTRSYANVTETLTLVLVGSTHDTAAARIQQLMQVLNTALWGVPCVLSIKPNGSTSAFATEIYSADVQPTAQILNVTGGFSTVALQVTITRAPFFGRLSSGESLLSATTIKNTGTGSPNNVIALSAGAGDLIYEGQPLNITFDTASGTPDHLLVSSILSRTYDASVAGVKSTSSTTGVASADSVLTTSALYSQPRLKIRVLARYSAVAANCQMRLGVQNGTDSAITFPTNWITPPASACLVDLGMAPLASPDRATNQGGQNIDLYVYQRSTDGAAAAATLSYMEILIYYDFCALTLDFPMYSGAATSLLIDSFYERTGAAALPRPRAIPAVYQSAQQVIAASLRGTAPRYFSGASLYAAWTNGGVHATAETIKLSATHSPLYRALRGAG